MLPVRIWEALYLGSIPVVVHSHLDPLFTNGDLPVLLVKSYTEVTPALLEVLCSLLQSFL